MGLWKIMTRLYRIVESVVLVLLALLATGEHGEQGELPSPSGLVLLLRLGDPHAQPEVVP
jgi:hypothetical protein